MCALVRFKLMVKLSCQCSAGSKRSKAGVIAPIAPSLEVADAWMAIEAAEVILNHVEAALVLAVAKYIEDIES